MVHKMKTLKKFVKTTVASTLLAGLMGNTQVVSPFQSVTENANSIHQLAKQDATEVEIFTALSLLTESIVNVVDSLTEKRFKLKDSKFETLLVLRSLLDFTSSFVVDKYEEAIWGEYQSQYRAYSRSIGRLDMVIFKIREKKGLIHRVAVEGLSLSDDELAEIDKAAKQRSTQYAESHA